jgi:hypothetical protein
MKRDSVAEKQRIFVRNGAGWRKRRIEFDEVNEFAGKDTIYLNFGLCFMKKSDILGVL